MLQPWETPPRLRGSRTEGPCERGTRRLGTRGVAIGNEGSQEIRFRDSPGRKEGFTPGVQLLNEVSGSWGNARLRPKMTPREREGRRTRSRSVSRPRRSEGGGLSEGVTGWRSERSPSAAPTRAQTGGVPSARPTQDSNGLFPRAGLGVSELCLGYRIGIRAGRR